MPEHPDGGSPASPPTEAALFDMPAPPEAVERLLLLATQFTRHNDALDRRLDAGADPAPELHADSAHRLAAGTRTAIGAIGGLRLYESVELAETMARLTQLAHLAAASVDCQARLARRLTTLAPEAAVQSADTLAAEMRRRRMPPATAADDQLQPVHQAALAEIARGHVVVNSSTDREIARWRQARVVMSTLRALQAKGYIDRAPKTAHPPYYGGPPQDRVRLTRAGATALAATLGQPPAPATSPAAAAQPATVAKPSPARSR